MTTINRLAHRVGSSRGGTEEAVPSASRPRTWRERVFHLYVGGVIAAGFGVLAACFAALDPARAAGPHPAAFALFAVLVLVADLFPLRWLRRREGGEVTTSWAFAFALLLIAPPAGAILAFAAATCIADVILRKLPVRMLFNTAQVSLSLAAGAVVMTAAGYPDGALTADGLQWQALVAMAVAGTIAFTLNGALVCTVLALHRREPVWPFMLRGVTFNLSTDGVLLALTPVFVLVARESAVLLPLLLLTVYTVHRSGYLTLARHHEATHDSLTDLPNRRLFLERLAQTRDVAKRRGKSLAVALLDLDGFKEINDRLGHAVGDMVLIEVAERLDANRRSTDVVARTGGDEFALLLNPVDDEEQARSLAEHLVTQLERPCTRAGFPLAVSASLGLAIARECDDIEHVLRQADMAMYAAKRDCVSVAVYDHGSDGNGMGRLALLGGLQKAIADEELVVHFQPMLDLHSLRVTGLEALVRWQHPTLGLVQPDAFIALAEQTELMTPFTTYVMRRALRQCASWHALGLRVSVAVNGSARNLHDLGFPEHVAALLGETGVEARWLELEITEHTVMANPPRSLAVLDRLREMGVRVAIDDYGTGYSSLATLRDLRVDRVKIDRSFVYEMAQRPGNASIVRSIIDLAHELGVATVAEGVEDDAVLSLLGDSGCDAAQGYSIARPGPAHELEPLLLAGVFGAQSNGHRPYSGASAKAL